MRKFTVLAISAIMAAVCYAQTPKYVFYLISDGTGVNIVQAAEHYRADVRKQKEGKALGDAEHQFAPELFRFSQFPVVGIATTYSGSTRVTDSAASGTALATGHKTYNGAIGVALDKTPIYSVAKAAKEHGMAVGVASSVSINHATPAAFYAHNESRHNYHDIGHQLIDCDYVDFFGGSAIIYASDEKAHPGEEHLYTLAEKKGKTVCKGMADYRKKVAKAKKVILVQEDGKDEHSLPYVIDHKDGELTIEEIFQAELDFLQKADNGKGFFLMNEIGGKVDWADHASDAAAAFAELESVNNCVEIAYNFYKQHPDETLIVFTSDHDTGCPTIGTGNYEAKLAALESQKISKDRYTDYLTDLRKQTNNNVTWEMVEQSLKDLWGFWTVHKLSDAQTAELKAVYEKSFGAHAKGSLEKSLYKSNEKLSSTACRILGDIAMIRYAHGGHSGGYVPVCAIGAGAEQFRALNDNAQIPKLIAKLIGTEL